MVPKAKDSGLEGHYDMISSVDGKPVDKEARSKARKKAGVTSASYDYNTPGNEWNCTVYFEHGEPFRMNFYIWNASQTAMIKSLSEDLGYPISMTGINGGNGHYSCKLKKV
jgi:hypothetical protein